MKLARRQSSEMYELSATGLESADDLRWTVLDGNERRCWVREKIWEERLMMNDEKSVMVMMGWMEDGRRRMMRKRRRKRKRRLDSYRGAQEREADV
jgi:hypothetical protein